MLENKSGTGLPFIPGAPSSDSMVSEELKTAIIGEEVDAISGGASGGHLPAWYCRHCNTRNVARKICSKCGREKE